MKGALLTILVFILGCSNDRTKQVVNGPIGDSLPLAKNERLQQNQPLDSSLAIHPQGTMEKVVRDINGHINRIPKTKIIDADFIEIMRIFNQAIMEMAFMAQQKGKNETLKKWASYSLTSKREENIALGKMKDRHSYGQQHNDAFYQDINRFLQDSLYLPPTSTLSVDEQFAILLVPHHQRAIAAGRLFSLCISLNVYYLLRFYVKEASIKIISVIVILILQIYFLVKLINQVSKWKKKEKRLIKTNENAHKNFSEN